MIKFLKTDDKKIVHIECEGEITDEEYKKTVIPYFEKRIAEVGKLSVLCDMRKVKSIEGKAIYDDFKFGTRHRKDFDRLATVGDMWWLGPLMTLANPFYNMELKHFPSEQYNEAKKWIHKKD